MFRFLRSRPWMSLFLSAALLPWLVAAQCANAVIPFPIKKDFDFTIDIDALAGQALKDKNVSAENGKIPQGAPDINVPIKIEKTIDLQDDPNVKQYGNKLSYVEINAINVTVKTNTANIPLPTLKVEMSNKGAAQFQVVGDLRSIKAGETGLIENMIKTDAQRTLAGSYILKFAFDIRAVSEYILKAGMEVPKGKIDVVIGVDVKLGLAPFK